MTMPPDGAQGRVHDGGGAPGGDAHRGVHDLEARLTEIVGVILELAALRFDARATVSRAGDIVDAVAAGVNALGEELAASYEEMEQRVADRTAELARATAELSHRALHDDLTGLLNRPAFWDRLTHRIETGARRGTGFAVLFIDLDEFKRVNDTLGHAAGDQVLVEVARRVSAELRNGDTTARVGGDEFLVLLDEVADADAALAVARRVAERLGAPHEVAGREVAVTSSIGVAVGPGFACGDSLVAAADTAMYAAKRAGGAGCVLYDVARHGRPGMEA